MTWPTSFKEGNLTWLLSRPIKLCSCIFHLFYKITFLKDLNNFYDLRQLNSTAQQVDIHIYISIYVFNNGFDILLQQFLLFYRNIYLIF